MKFQKYLKEFVTTPVDAETIVNVIAKKRFQPMQHGEKQISGEVSHNDIYDMINDKESNPNDKLKLFSLIAVGLQKRGFWVHS